MEIKQAENITPEKEDIVTLKIAGNVMEIRFSKNSAGSPIKKISKDYGIDVRTGEVVEYQHTTSRAGDKASVKQSMKRLRDIINANLENPGNALWVTLTYAENMRDEKRLYADFHAFFKRFRRYLKRQGQPPAEYITAAEPQGRGAWHLHMLLLFSGNAPFIPNEEMAEIWGQGFTKTKSLKGIDNPGLYLTAYLGDMEIMEAAQAGAMNGKINEVDVTGEDGTRQKKAIIKGARLSMYPPGFNIYRTSRGVKRPTESKMTEGEAQEIVGDAPLIYEKTLQVIDGAGDIRNTISYRTYIKKPVEGGAGPPADKHEEPGNADTPKQGR